MLSSIKIKLKTCLYTVTLNQEKNKLNSLINLILKYFIGFVSYLPSNTTNLNKSSISSVGSVSGPIVSLNGWILKIFIYFYLLILVILNCKLL